PRSRAASTTTASTDAAAQLRKNAATALWSRVAASMPPENPALANRSETTRFAPPGLSIRSRGARVAQPAHGPLAPEQTCGTNRPRNGARVDVLGSGSVLTSKAASRLRGNPGLSVGAEACRPAAEQEGARDWSPVPPLHHRGSRSRCPRPQG